MSEVKHTPGPWLTSERKGFMLLYKENKEQGEITTIAEIEAVNLEDAKLIAAAPDMYEIVKELYDWAQDTQVFGPIYPKLEAVINKLK